MGVGDGVDGMGVGVGAVGGVAGTVGGDTGGGGVGVGVGGATGFGVVEGAVLGGRQTPTEHVSEAESHAFPSQHASPVAPQAMQTWLARQTPSLQASPVGQHPVPTSPHGGAGGGGRSGKLMTTGGATRAFAMQKPWKHVLPAVLQALWPAQQRWPSPPQARQI